MNEEEKEIQLRNAITTSMQYYKIIGYKSFAKQILGEKIIERKLAEKSKPIYRKNKEGEIEREYGDKRIISLDNTVILIDEAHNFTGNTYEEALMKLIRNSRNLKVVLLTATPMGNFADDIVPLIN